MLKASGVAKAQVTNNEEYINFISTFTKNIYPISFTITLLLMGLEKATKC